MNQQDTLCVLCLRILEDGESCSELNKMSILEDLKLVNLSYTKDFDLSEESLVCGSCTTELSNFGNFKEKIVSNELKLKQSLEPNLIEFLLTLSKDVNVLCRTCLTTPTDDEVFERNWIDSEDVLLQCDIHLNKDIPIPSKLCSWCYSKLEAMKDFILLCSENKMRIKEIQTKYNKYTNKELASIIKEAILKVKSSSLKQKTADLESSLPKDKMELEKDLHLNTSGTPKIYRKRKSSMSEGPSTSQSSAERILNRKLILKKMKEQIQQMHNSIDASPSLNHADVTLNFDHQGLLIDTPSATEYNLTQELIDVLEGRLNEDTSIDEATQELIDVLEGKINESSTPRQEVDSASKKSKLNKGLKQQTIQYFFNGKISKSPAVEISEVPTVPVVEVSAEPVVEVSEEPVVEINETKRKLRKPRQEQKEAQEEVVACESAPKKKRGRPPKIKSDPQKEKSEPPKKKAKTVEVVESESSSDETMTQIEEKMSNRPVQVTLIKGKKRKNKAQLDKTWEELTGAGASKDSQPQPSSVKKPEKKDTTDRGLEITVVKKRGKQGFQKASTAKPKKEVLWLYCEKCSFKTYAQNSFIQHQLIHSVMSDLPTLFCDHCRFNTTSEELMMQHKNTHETANLSYKCVFCDDFFKKKSSCMYHTLRHDDQDVASQFYCLVYNGAADEEYFECYQCDYQNTEESPMPDHVIDHTIEIPKNPMVAKFKCDECPYMTKTEEMLDRHLKLHHDNGKNRKKKIKEESNATEEPPLLKCDKCHYMTRHHRSLINHVGLKHNRSIPPMIAGEAAAAKAATEGQTMYYCNECSYSTYRKLNMPRHMLVHRTKENMEMHECPHCIFETKHRRSYTRHMEARHGVVV